MISKYKFFATIPFFLLFLIPTKSLANTFIEDFDSYNTSATLAGQGNWTTSGTSDIVTANQFQTASFSYQNWRNGTNKIVSNVLATSTDSIYSYYFYETNFTTGTNNPAGLVEFTGYNSSGVAVATYYTGWYPTATSHGNVRVSTASNLNGGFLASTTPSELNQNTWYRVDVYFDYTNHTVCVSRDYGSCTSFVNIGSTVTHIGKITIENNSATSKNYVDSINANYGTNTNTRIIAVVPADSSSGSVTLASTTPVTLGVDAYVSKSDYVDGITTTFTWSKYSANLKSGFCVGVSDCRSGGMSTTTETLTLSGVASYGEFVSTGQTAHNLDVGRYTLTTTINAPYLWFWTKNIISTTTSFVVDSLTAQDIATKQTDDSIKNDTCGQFPT